jgi:hypothetical protein
VVQEIERACIISRCLGCTDINVRPTSSVQYHHGWEIFPPSPSSEAHSASYLILMKCYPHGKMKHVLNIV